MRPRFRLAIAVIATCSTARLNRWTHRVGVTGRARNRHPHLDAPTHAQTHAFSIFVIPPM